MIQNLMSYTIWIIDEIMDKQQQLDQLYQKLEGRASSLPLAKTAKDIVPGEGPATAEVLFIGEAPGQQEAIERRPFVGRSGKFFRQTLEEIEISDKDVYISNIVKVRPPENRDPTIEEIAAFKPYLDKEIEIIDPALIVTLGRFSMAKFLADVRISQVHGRLHKVKWNGKTQFVLPMYHPAAGLRSTTVRQAFIEDFKKIPKAVAWINDHQQDFELEEIVKDTLL